MSLNVLLIRHGQSEWNEAGRWQGQQDPPLTEAGRNDARAAARVIGALDAMVSSHLQRASETAQYLADAIGVGPVFTDRRWAERSAGPWEGLTRPEIEAGWPGFLEAGNRPEGWESDEALVGRAMASLGDLWQQMGDGELAVVTHSGLIMALEAHMGEPVGRMPNLGGRWLRGDAADRWQLGRRVQLVDAAGSPGVVE
ncbi:MAG: histidine phosphatase family protein [Microthrixaceae bacterium]